MYLIRDIMNCKPGQVRPMVEKFKAANKAMKKLGVTPGRLFTDVSGERFWTVVFETEFADLAAHTAALGQLMTDKNMQKIMADYHDLVVSGRREIYQIEE